MRVTIVSCVYPPEPVVSARTSADLAAELSLLGHRVTVIAPWPNRPQGRIYPGFKRRWLRVERSSGGRTLARCFTFFSRRSTLPSRLLENLSFGVATAWAMGRLERPDVVYANTWPLFATGILTVLCRVRGIPIVTSIQDLYPESLVSQGRSRSDGAITRFLRWLDTWLLRQNKALIAISERFASILRNRAAGKLPQIHVIPNWMAPETIDVSVDASAGRARWGVPAAARLIVYAGNIGAASGIEDVIKAMGSVQKTAEAYLLIAGHGSRLDACRELAARIDPKRILFHSPWAEEETSLVLRAADILLLPTRGRQSLVSLPSKMLTYMLAARPILALAQPESDLASAIDRAGCGWLVPPDEPQALAEIIQQLTSISPDILHRKGQAGRSYVLQHHNPDICISRLIGVLLGCGGRSGPDAGSN